jgi:hypothetical protein
LSTPVYFILRLNCSVLGEYSFYFNDIQGVTPLVRGQYGGQQQDQSGYDDVDVERLV